MSFLFSGRVQLSKCAKNFTLPYANSANDKISLDITDAKIARVTADISTPQKAATITWTVASGAAQ